MFHALVLVEVIAQQKLEGRAARIDLRCLSKQKRGEYVRGGLGGKGGGSNKKEYETARKHSEMISSAPESPRCNQLFARRSR